MAVVLQIFQENGILNLRMSANSNLVVLLFEANQIYFSLMHLAFDSLTNSDVGIYLH